MEAFYSEVPNTRVDRNMQADWYFFKKFIKEQAGINKQGEMFVEN
jgi:hypothetical protein